MNSACSLTQFFKPLSRGSGQLLPWSVTGKHGGNSMAENSTPAVIQLDGLTKHFGNVIALQDVTLDVPLGITGLLGPNGAGKSKLLEPSVENSRSPVEQSA